MNKTWKRIALAAALGAGLILVAPAKFLDDAPPPGADARPAMHQAPPGADAAPPPHQPNGPGMPPGERLSPDLTLNRLLEIQAELDALEKTRGELIDTLAKLKDSAKQPANQDAIKNERQIRETTAKLHETIEERQELVGQKMRLYARGAGNSEEFRQFLANETERVNKEINKSAPGAGKNLADRQRNLKAIQGDLDYWKNNPETFERMRQFSADGDSERMGMGEGTRRRWPGGPDSASRSEWRQRWQSGNAPILPPADPQVVQQRLERLERELNFLRAQSDRIEREIEVLQDWVAGQKQDSPKPELQEFKESVE